MFLMGFLGKGIAAVRERAAIPFVTTRSVQPKEWCMEFKEYDFIRNPVVQNEVFPAIEMWCVWFFGSGALT